MEDGPNLIALAVPAFFLLMGVEFLVARSQGRTVFRLADALADVGCGVGQQVGLVFIGAGSIAGYLALYPHRLLVLPTGAAWALAIVGIDVLYYCWHRASHRVNLLWAAHAVHHQSEDYNLAVALRQSLFTPFTSMPFYLPLALLGVPPGIFAAAVSINTLYQFWIHTELVGKLPRAVEWVLNTPSHHRVHHAVDAAYLDRNYAGMFIVWDRLFGTLVVEEARPTYGTVKRLASFNSLRAQVAEFGVVLGKVRGTGARNALRVWLMPPEWLPSGALPIPSPPTSKVDSPATDATQVYAGLQFLAATATGVAMIWFENAVEPVALIVPGVFVFATLLAVGGLLDGSRWGRAAEALRLTLVASALTAWLWPQVGLLALGCPLLCAASGLALWQIQPLRAHLAH